ncbi:threonine/serine exporter family protein [Enterococcus camelliae]|uniref:Threonine/serine exporter family protein n=1 Tax=Enterococcus camelliae TaxID=453959 RepID=A0ABW5THE3_9ENTE
MTDSRDLLMETCLLAGRIMMENGSEVYRVEDTMNRIAKNGGEPKSVSYVTATGIFMSFRNQQLTQIESVGDRLINLEKVVAVNRLSREFAENKITLQTLNHSLKEANQHTPSFPLYLQIICAGIVSSTLMYAFGGTWMEFFPTFLVGASGFFVSIFIKKRIELRFFDMFFASFLIGVIAILLGHFFQSMNADHIIIGGVMPLVPGVAITNSFRDILAGHIISGQARGTEAIIVASAIAVGIATALTLLGGLL